MNRLWWLALLVACTAAPPEIPQDPVSQPPVLDRYEGSLGPGSLNLSITLFQSDLPNPSVERMKLVPAELRYLSFLLRQQLSASGYWGAVRVTPDDDVTAEVVCRGRLLDAVPERLEILMRCSDVSGRPWLEEIFQETVPLSAYSVVASVYDPYLDLMTRIANRLAKLRLDLTLEDRQQLAKLALLRYGETLSPQHFSAYLGENEEGFKVLRRLPAEEDPMLQRVLRIRATEHQLIDALDEQCEVIFEAMKAPYHWWRGYQFEFDQYNQSLGQKQDATNGKIATDYRALLATYRRYQDYRRNQDELTEMSQSLAREITPTLTQVEGQVVELTGSLTGQYELWRSYLQQIYDAEGSPNQP